MPAISSRKFKKVASVVFMAFISLMAKYGVFGQNGWGSWSPAVCSRMTERGHPFAGDEAAGFGALRLIEPVRYASTMNSAQTIDP